MLYLYSYYLIFCYMRNIYGIYVTLRFFRYLLGYTYDFFSYFFVKEQKLICDKDYKAKQPSQYL